MSGDHEMQNFKQEMKKIIVEELEEMKMDVKEEMRHEMQKMKEEVRAKLWDLQNFKSEVREQVHTLGGIKSEVMEQLKETREDLREEIHWTFKDQLTDELKIWMEREFTAMDTSLNDDLQELRQTTDGLKEDMHNEINWHSGPEWAPSEKKHIDGGVAGFFPSLVTCTIMWQPMRDQPTSTSIFFSLAV